uniref:NR LBD domain-containing protein n=1 Tax=Heterorhabditis bacteriophora TaxID=37862 RepID=A0A1I7WTR5_HETBA
MDLKQLEKLRIYIKDIHSLSIIDRYLPSDEFLTAVSALTLEQKGHIEQLGLAKRKWELEKIMDGIILSLPDELQIKSQNFVYLLKALGCIQSSLQGYQHPESQLIHL